MLAFPLLRIVSCVLKGNNPEQGAMIIFPVQDCFLNSNASISKYIEQVPHWNAGVSIEETILSRAPGLFPLSRIVSLIQTHWNTGVWIEEIILSRAPGLLPQARIVSSIEMPAFPLKLFGLRKQFKQQETIFYKIKHTSNNQIIWPAWGAKRIECAAGWGARF